jgi:hypothetical protein
MIPVIPKWQAHAVENWQELLVENSEGKVELSLATVAIFNYMPVIGIIELTAENVEDAWRRIAILEALRGSFLSNSETRKPLFLTKTDLERYVGAETEGTKMSFQQFCAQVASWSLSTDQKELPSFIANGNATLLELSGVGATLDFTIKDLVTPQGIYQVGLRRW